MKIFQNMMLSAAMTFGLAVTATGQTAQCMNCGDPQSPPPSTLQSLTIGGLSLIGGNVGSQFMGTQGANDVFKVGNTTMNINSTLGGFCNDGNCADTTVSADLSADESGGALTGAATETSGQTAGVMNSGNFQSMVGLTLGYNGLNTNIQGAGMAGFANEAVAQATGDHVNTQMVSFGEGGSSSQLATDGTACPTCVGLIGGQSVAAAAGTHLLSQAWGGTSGNMVSIGNNAQTNAAAQLGTLFDQNQTGN